jgi:hypothetical protein
MKSKLSAAVAATGCALALSIGVARADIITQTLTIPALATTTFGSQSNNTIVLFTNSFNQFNPNLGTLNTISSTISGTVVWTVDSGFFDLFVEVLTTNPPGNFQLATTNIGHPQGQYTIPIALTPQFGLLLLGDFTGTSTSQLRLLFSDSAMADTISSANGFSGSITYDYTPAAAVPEPSTWAMMILGFAGVGFMAYRRKSKPALMAA